MVTINSIAEAWSGCLPGSAAAHPVGGGGGGGGGGGVPWHLPGIGVVDPDDQLSAGDGGAVSQPWQ